jgi:hypothetical protein
MGGDPEPTAAATLRIFMQPQMKIQHFFQGVPHFRKKGLLFPQNVL